MEKLASILPGYSLLPWPPPSGGGLLQNHTHESLLACRGRQELSYWRWASNSVRKPLCPSLKGQEVEPTIGYFPVPTQARVLRKGRIPNPSRTWGAYILPNLI